MPRPFIIVVIALVVQLGLATRSRAVTWVNETNLAAEADFANLQFPTDLTVQASQSTGLIYGDLFEAGLTETQGAPANVLADVGYGPSGSDPRTNANWQWFAATYHAQIGNNDEFKQAFTAPATAGTYSYTYRYSLDNGGSYTAADMNGAGSGAGLTFSAANLGVLTVTALAPNEIDNGNLQFPTSFNLQASTLTGSIIGRVYEAGVTEAPGDSGAITASLGYGPSGTDPRTSQQWTWTTANYGLQSGSSDEYQVGFTTPAVNGTYWYTYKFSLNNGTTWTVTDLDGNGTSGGLSFDLNQLGVLTVTGGTNPTFNPADFDKDLDVDGADLTKWRNNFGAGNNMADSDTDSDSDGADMLRWQRELGTIGLSPISAAVPEPLSASLAICGVLAVAACQRNRSRG